MRFEIPLATALRHLGGPAISPDGARLAYGPGGAEGQKLYVRALESADTVPLPGTEGARQPFFSPDGGSLGFFARDLLMKVELATGHVTKVCHAARISRGGNWGTDNRIYFARGRYAGIWVVSADGGQPEPLTNLAPEEVAHGWPELLPGGRHLLFTRWHSEVLDDAKIEALSLETGERRTVMEGGVGARYLPTGHLLYVRSGTLMAVFDGAPLWRPDDPSSILFTMARGQHYAFDLFSVPADASRAPELVYESPHDKYATSASAVARLVAFIEIRPATKADIWLLDISGRPTARPFLQTPFWESTPALSPDGKWLAYESDEAGRVDVYVRAVSGSGAKWQVSSGGGDRPRWSRDGRQIVYRRGNSMMAARVATGPLLTVDRPRILLAGEFEEGGSVTPNYDIAPDGRRFLMIEPSQDPEPAPSRLVVIDNWFAELRAEARAMTRRLLAAAEGMAQE